VAVGLAREEEEEETLEVGVVRLLERKRGRDDTGRWRGAEEGGRQKRERKKR